MGFEPVGDEAIASGVRLFLLEWVGEHTDWHAFEDYTEVMVATLEGERAVEQPGSHRVVIYKPRVLSLVVRPRVEDEYLVLEEFEEGYHGFLRRGSAKFELGNPGCWGLLGSQLRVWARK